MSTNSLGGMDRKRAEWVYWMVLDYLTRNMIPFQTYEAEQKAFIDALVDGRSYNVMFDRPNLLNVTLIAVAVDELRQPMLTVHGTDLVIDTEHTDRLNQSVRRKLLQERRFNDEEIFDLLWDVQCFLREHDEEGHDIDVRFTIGVTMAWCRQGQFSHSELRNWKRMIFGRFDDDVDYPLVKLIAINGEFDEEGSKALNNKLRTVIEF